MAFFDRSWSDRVAIIGVEDSSFRLYGLLHKTVEVYRAITCNALARIQIEFPVMTLTDQLAVHDGGSFETLPFVGAELWNTPGGLSNGNWDGLGAGRASFRPPHQGRAR